MTAMPKYGKNNFKICLPLNQLTGGLETCMVCSIGYYHDYLNDLLLTLTFLRQVKYGKMLEQKILLNVLEILAYKLVYTVVLTST